MRIRFSAKSILLAATSMTMAGAASPSMAQTEQAGLEDIVVVSRKREENIQDVPISITAMSGNDLRQRGVVRVADMVNSVPNMTQDGGGAVLGAFGLRGIVSQTRNIGFDSGLGVYVDGALVVRPSGADQELPDIASVEVLRGPQGTLFGRNTTAGAINIITKTPSDSFTFDGRAAAGNLGMREASGYVSGPLVEDVLKAKLSASIAKRDGYVENLVDNKDYNGVNRQTVRGGLLWTPTDDLKIGLTADYLRQRDTLILGQIADNTTGLLAGAPGFFTDRYVIAQDAPNYQDRDSWGTNLRADWTLGGFTLTSISAFGRLGTHTEDDDDARPFPVSASNFQDIAKQFTQELRLASPAGGTFDYLVGLYYLTQNADSNRATTVTGPTVGQIRSVSGLDTDAYAVFVSGNWRPAERVTVSGGLRYSSESKDLSFVQTNTSFLPLPALTADLSRDDSNVSGNLSLSYEVVDDTRLYASIARGFKSGGYNPDIVGDTDIGFGPEELWSYEAGLKSEFLDRRVRFNAAAFYSDYSDLQVSSLVGAAFQIRNAGKAEIKGAELEIAARPVEPLELNVGVGYTDATYKSFPGCAVATDCAGNRLPFVPKWTLSGGAEYTHPIGEASFVARADVTYRSSTFSEATSAPDGKIGGYTLVNGRVGFKAPDGRWGIALFGKNLFDKRYQDFSFFFAPFGQREVRWAVPRTYGVELTTHF